MSFYEEIAEYYDLIFPFNRGQAGFVTNCLGESFHGKKVLDVGCGTGDLVVALSEVGFQAIGVDSDSEMLRLAEAKASGVAGATFLRVEMGEVGESFGPSAFEGVLCFGNTLVHLKDYDEVQGFCKKVRTVLKDGGKFLIQVLNYDHILDRHIEKLPLIENESIRFERYYDYGNDSGRVAFRTVLTIKETGKVIENEIYLYPMRRRELNRALRGSGFTQFFYYADFDKSDLRTDSLPLVVEAHGKVL